MPMWMLGEQHLKSRSHFFHVLPCPRMPFKVRKRGRLDCKQAGNKVK